MYDSIFVWAVVNEKREASFQRKAFTSLWGWGPRTATTEVSQDSLCLTGITEARSSQIVGLGSIRPMYPCIIWKLKKKGERERRGKKTRKERRRERGKEGGKKNKFWSTSENCVSFFSLNLIGIMELVIVGVLWNDKYVYLAYILGSNFWK